MHFDRASALVASRLLLTIMATMSTSVAHPAGLSNLTVAQLKALCKERAISGYSKLSKPALLQKLADQASGSTASLNLAPVLGAPVNINKANAKIQPSVQIDNAGSSTTGTISNISTESRQGYTASAGSERSPPITTTDMENSVGVHDLVVSQNTSPSRSTQSRSLNVSHSHSNELESRRETDSSTGSKRPRPPQHLELPEKNGEQPVQKKQKKTRKSTVLTQCMNTDNPDAPVTPYPISTLEISQVTSHNVLTGPLVPKPNFDGLFQTETNSPSSSSSKVTETNLATSISTAPTSRSRSTNTLMPHITPPVELAKLTVSQLTALCKEHGISGYSKLSKSALIQKLSDHESATTSPATCKVLEKTNSVYMHSPLSINTSTGMANKTAPVASQQSRKTSTVKDTLTAPDLVIFGDALAANKPLPHIGPLGPTSSLADGSHSRLNVASHTSELDDQHQSIPVSKRLPCDLDPIMSNSNAKKTAQKKQKRTSLAPQNIDSEPLGTLCLDSVSNASKVTSTGSMLPPTVSNANAKAKLFNLAALCTSLPTPMPPVALTDPPSEASVSSDPSHVLPHQGTQALKGAGASNQNTIDQAIKHAPKRFKPLLVKNAAPALLPNSSFIPETLAGPVAKAKAPSLMPHFYLEHLKLNPDPESVVLTPINLPPKLMQRRHVHKWSIILSGITNAERRHCVCVSRMFRYAGEVADTVFLSRSNTIFHQSND